MFPTPARPPDEDRRLAALGDLRILHTLPERAYDDVVALAALVCDAPVALLSFVDREELWCKAAVGTVPPVIPRDVALCSWAILAPGDVLVIADTHADARFRDNPLVTGAEAIRFYAGAPIVTERGDAVGTLCVIDRAPRADGSREAAALRLIARLAAGLLERRRDIGALEERALAEHAHLQRLEAVRRDAETERARLEAAAMVDAATGAGTRRALHQRLDEEVARAHRAQSPLSLLLLELDPAPGGGAPDARLAVAAEVMRGALRTEDALFRTDERTLAVLLPGVPLDGGLILAERLRRAVAGHGWREGAATLSCGVASLGGAIRHRMDLLHAAEDALHGARRGGRNRVTPYLMAAPSRARRVG